MCGISGSFYREEAFALYEANLVRGRYSAGMLVNYASEVKNHQIIKSSKPFIEDDLPLNGNLYLLHSRAPTSHTIEYREIDTHPFSVGNIHVAHNGIITNAEELAQKYDIDYSDPNASLVDSYVIPYIINHYYQTHSIEVAIHFTLNELKGTFGLWIWVNDGKEGRAFICRNGSTLYGNQTAGSFSSSPCIDLELLPEGKLFQLDKEYGLLLIGSFITKPIYYIP